MVVVIDTLCCVLRKFIGINSARIEFFLHLGLYSNYLSCREERARCYQLLLCQIEALERLGIAIVLFVYTGVDRILRHAKSLLQRKFHADKGFLPLVDVASILWAIEAFCILNILTDISRDGFLPYPSIFAIEDEGIAIYKY